MENDTSTSSRLGRYLNQIETSTIGTALVMQFTFWHPIYDVHDYDACFTIHILASDLLCRMSTDAKPILCPKTLLRKFVSGYLILESGSQQKFQRGSIACMRES